jgi:hypothetical protein
MHNHTFIHFQAEEAVKALTERKQGELATDFGAAEAAVVEKSKALVQVSERFSLL